MVRMLPILAIRLAACNLMVELPVPIDDCLVHEYMTAGNSSTQNSCQKQAAKSNGLLCANGLTVANASNCFNAGGIASNQLIAFKDDGTPIYTTSNSGVPGSLNNMTGNMFNGVTGSNSLNVGGATGAAFGNGFMSGASSGPGKGSHSGKIGPGGTSSLNNQGHALPFPLHIHPNGEIRANNGKPIQVAQIPKPMAATTVFTVADVMTVTVTKHLHHRIPEQPRTSTVTVRQVFSQEVLKPVVSYIQRPPVTYKEPPATTTYTLPPETVYQTLPPIIVTAEAKTVTKKPQTVTHCATLPPIVVKKDPVSITVIEKYPLPKDTVTLTKQLPPVTVASPPSIVTLSTTVILPPLTVHSLVPTTSVITTYITSTTTLYVQPMPATTTYLVDHPRRMGKGLHKHAPISVPQITSPIILAAPLTGSASMLNVGAPVSPLGDNLVQSWPPTYVMNQSTDASGYTVPNMSGTGSLVQSSSSPGSASGTSRTGTILNTSGAYSMPGIYPSLLTGGENGIVVLGNGACATGMPSGCIPGIMSSTYQPSTQGASCNLENTKLCSLPSGGKRQSRQLTTSSGTPQFINNPGDPNRSGGRKPGNMNWIINKIASLVSRPDAMIVSGRGVNLANKQKDGDEVVYLSDLITRQG